MNRPGNVAPGQASDKSSQGEIKYHTKLATYVKLKYVCHLLSVKLVTDVNVTLL